MIIHLSISNQKNIVLRYVWAIGKHIHSSSRALTRMEFKVNQQKRKNEFHWIYLEQTTLM